ncbi:unnamed protein product [Lymnaea stagnalis]|uniref:45 kDa calcium-binding protein n=1 Tax=Lymnaea stagnalis TaxID=6523 RepID=A0AAV2H8S9_LYMST
MVSDLAQHCYTFRKVYCNSTQSSDLVFLYIKMVPFRILLCVQILACLAYCGPIPRTPSILVGHSQDHQIDNVEIHHDVDVDKSQGELAVDSLPEQPINDAAGDRQLSKDEQQQQQPLDVVEMAIGNDVNAAHEVKDTLKDKLRLILTNGSQDENIDLNMEMVKKFKKLTMEQLVPVDHLDVVKMEQDGHVNKEYHKEMFLGGLHDEFKVETFDDATIQLQEIVNSADLDKDGFLSKPEMEKWILNKMMEHFASARKENELIFDHLDPDGDGYIKWKEYYVHFLLSRGFDVQSAMQHVLDYEDGVKLDQDDKDALISYKFKWTDADNNITDNKLSKDEFMIFRHPEHSKQTLETMVINVMRGVDSNKDGVITEEEFAALPPGEVEGKEFEEMDRKWQEERKIEFREIMDANKDGKVDLPELKSYLDPTNPIQAKLEADTLLSLMDDDKNNLLSMEEILKHSDIFISSKLVNFERNIHDEF